jgi:hypothetical protein
MTFFTILKDILTKGNSKEYYLEHPDFDKVFSSFMLARYLSMRSDLMMWARLINHLNVAKVSPRNIFIFAWDSIPKQKNGYIPYIKKDKRKGKKK